MSAIHLNSLIVTLLCRVVSLTPLLPTLHNVASELLIALLNEISPDRVADSPLLGQLHANGVPLTEDNRRSFEQDDYLHQKSFTDDSTHGNDGSKPKQVSKPLASMSP